MTYTNDKQRHVYVYVCTYVLVWMHVWVNMCVLYISLAYRDSFHIAKGIQQTDKVATDVSGKHTNASAI